MGHVLFRRWQPRAAAIIGVLLSFAVFAGAAQATTTTSSSGSATCTTDPGHCTFTGNGGAMFKGQFVQPLPTVDPAECAPQAGDSTDFFCGHFGMDFSNVTAKVTVSISFDGDAADLDLCVGSGAAPGAAVVGCSTGSGSTENLTFTVGCADTHFEALILPTMYITAMPSVMNPFPYSGSVTVSNVATCIAGQGNPPPGSQSASGHKVTGGGQVRNSDQTTSNFSVNVMETTGGFKGKAQIAQGAGCVFRGTEIDSVAWNDTAHDAKIFGKGTFRSDPNTLVQFVAEATDNGGGSSSPPDNYTIDQGLVPTANPICGGGGQVVSGNVTYHLPNQ
jgi:hypothetical protein